MTKTTLGQVLYEADPLVLDGHTVAWLDLPRRHMDQYESKAAAVATVVREQCAQVGDRIVIADPECDAHDAFNAGLRSMQASIRSMKP